MTEMLRASDGILDLLPIATFICDVRGVIVQYNRQAVALWGRAPRAGQTYGDFTKAAQFWESDGTPATRSLIGEVLSKGTSVRDVERLVKRSDGVRAAVSINVDPLFDAAGEVIGAVQCVQDITESKRAIDALEASRKDLLEHEQRFAATYEHVAIGISEIAPDGRILRVNEAMCSITGYGRQELQTRRLFGFTHADDIDSDREAFGKQVAGNLEFYSIEKRFVRQDGRIVWVSVRSSPVRDAAGRLLYIVRVVQDITEGKLAEQRQRLLIDELNHRVKNTLATVQSLAAQTARRAETPRAFCESFEGRLIALSKAHDQLTMHHWESADLRSLLSGAWRPHGAGPERIVLRGEDVRLRPRAVLTLAMAFHELDHQRRQVRRAVAAGRARRDPLAGDERRNRPAAAQDRLAGRRRAAGRRAGAARLRLAADRGGHRRRTRRQCAAQLRARGPALRDRDPACHHGR